MTKKDNEAESKGKEEIDVYAVLASLIVNAPWYVTAYLLGVFLFGISLGSVRAFCLVLGLGIALLGVIGWLAEREGE